MVVSLSIAILASSFHSVAHQQKATAAQTLAAFNKAAASLPELKRQATEIKLPLSMAEIIAIRPVSESENSTIEFGRVKQLYDSQQIDSVFKWQGRLSKATLQELSDLQAWFESHKEFYDALEIAANRPKLRFPLPKYDAAFQLWNGTTDYNILNRALGALLIRARTFALNGQFESAIKDIETAYKLPKFVADFPTTEHIIREFSMRSQCEWEAAAIAGILAKVKSSTERLEQVVMASPPLQTDQSWTYASDLIRYRQITREYQNDAKATWKHCVDSFTESGDNTTAAEKALYARVKTIPGIYTVPKKVAFDAITAKWLEAYMTAWKAKSNSNEPFAFTESCSQYFEKYKTSTDPVELICATQTLPFSMERDAYLRQDALRGALLAKIKVARFFAVNNKLPTTLAEAGVTALDPFSGDSFKYIVTQDSAKIYSIGANRKDDQGARNSENKDADDIVMRLSIAPTNATTQLDKNSAKATSNTSTVLPRPLE